MYKQEKKIILAYRNVLKMLRGFMCGIQAVCLIHTKRLKLSSMLRCLNRNSALRTSASLYGYKLINPWTFIPVYDKSHANKPVITCDPMYLLTSGKLNILVIVNKDVSVETVLRSPQILYDGGYFRQIYSTCKVSHGSLIFSNSQACRLKNGNKSTLQSL